MRALLYCGQRDIRLADVNIPECKSDEVLIKVTDAGLCQTQINEFIEGPHIINTVPHKVTGKALPLIAGHEFGGIVEKVGDTENNFQLIGKQVAVLPLLECGQCIHCKKGQKNECDDIIYYGLNGENGGFAEYACVKKNNIFCVDDENIITFIEPLLVAIHAANKIKSNIKDKKICILGAGTIGLCVAAVLQDYYGGNVVINDILSKRLERLTSAGFKIIRKLDLKNEYDIVVDCAGNNPASRNSAFSEGFNYLRKNGTLLSLGTYFHPVSIDPSVMLLNDYKVITSYLYSDEDVKLLPGVINALKTDFSSFITKIKLGNIIEDGYYRYEVDKDSFTRLVVTP